RNAVSVIPAMGATANGDVSSTRPICIGSSLSRRPVPPKVRNRRPALARWRQMNQVVVGAFVQPHSPVLTFFQHLNPRFAGWKPRTLHDALDLGVADDGGELAAGDLSGANELDPRFSLLSGD